MDLDWHCIAHGGGLDSSKIWRWYHLQKYLGYVTSRNWGHQGTPWHRRCSKRFAELRFSMHAAAKSLKAQFGICFKRILVEHSWFLWSLLLQRFIYAIFSLYTFSVNDVKHISISVVPTFHVSSLAWNTTSTAQWGAAWDWSIDTSRIILMNLPDMSSRDRWIKAPTMPRMSCSKASHPSHQQRNRMQVQRFIGAITSNLPRRVAMERQGRVSLNKLRGYPSI